jgi:hypothetical protein
MREWEMAVRRYRGVLATSAVIMLGGYALMLLVVPTDEQLIAVREASILSRLIEENVSGIAPKGGGRER